MAKQRLRRRRDNEAARVSVLRPNGTKWTPVRHVDFTEALRKIARREWRAMWYDTGELAGVVLTPPDRVRELVYIRCGSVECRKGWIFGADTRGRTKAASSVISFSRVLVDFIDLETELKLRRVSAELALKKIDLGYWKAIWCENGELAGVAAA